MATSVSGCPAFERGCDCPQCTYAKLVATPHPWVERSNVTPLMPPKPPHPAECAESPGAVNHVAPDGMRLVCAMDVQPETVRWFKRGHIPLGMLSGTFGIPGLGKTILAIEHAAQGSTGRLDGDLDGRQHVVYVSGEDAEAQTLVPRFLAAGGDPAYLHFVHVRRDGLDGGMVLPDDVADLERMVRQVSATLVVVDPLNAHLDGSIDSHRDADIRRALAPLARLAEATGAAVHIIGHLNKRDTSDLFLRVSGSVGVYGAIRSGLLVALDPEADDDLDDNDKPRVLVHGKHNVSAQYPTLRFAVVPHSYVRDDGEVIPTARIEWCGEAVGVGAADALGGRSVGRGPGRPVKVDAAAELLDKLLADGPRALADIEAAAEEAGFSWRTMERAKTAAGVVSWQPRDSSGKLSAALWARPDDPAVPA